MIKTLVYSADGQTVLALVRGDHEVNPAKLSRAAGGAELALASPEVITRLTGAAVGFAGPQGLAEKVQKLVIDHSVAAMPAGISGANKTDYHMLNVVPGRDFPLAGANAVVADIRNWCSRTAWRSGTSSSWEPSTASSWAPPSWTRRARAGRASWGATASA
jgi:prolyl-tRNA synthetase